MFMCIFAIVSLNNEAMKKSNHFLFPRFARSGRMCNKLCATVGLLAVAVLTCCKPTPSGGNEPSKQEPPVDGAVADTSKSAAANQQSASAPAAVTHLTFEQAKAMVTPGQKYDEQSVEALFASIDQPKVAAERYIWDADFGGDSPAISYTWGNHVAFKDWELTNTEANYYGVHFNFFFDDSRKTGKLKQLEIITDDSTLYEQFMSDARAAGLKLAGLLDKAVYGHDGKEYVLKTSNGSMFFIHDFSADGAYSLELGYDDGADV